MNDKTNTQKKIISIAKVMKVFFQIIYVFTIVGVIGCAIGMVCVAFLDYEPFIDFLKKYEEAQIIEDMLEVNIAQTEIECFSGLVGCFFSMFYIGYLKKMFASIVTNETPFNDKTIFYLNRVAILIIVSALAKPIIMGIACGIAEAVGGDIKYPSIEGANIMVSIILFAIAYIFKYGVQLQKEHDEIL